MNKCFKGTGCIKEVNRIITSFGTTGRKGIDYDGWEV